MQRTLTDFTKVIAAVAVVGIHATSLSEHSFARQQNFFSADFAAVFVNQWARFSVPLFLYLSAFGLGQSKALGYFSFLKKRLPTILIPYLFFSALAFALDYKNLTTANVADRLLKGGADYHLYFLVILAQCYVLFPLLARMYDAHPRFYTMATALAFLLVVLLLYRTSSERILGYLGLSHPGWHASFCIYWLPYFMLGLLHAKAPPSPWGKFTAVAAVAVSLAMVLTDYILASRQGIPVDYYNHFSRPAVALYALAVIYLLWALTPPVRGGEQRVPPNRGDLGGLLAPLTFTVYLIHPQILRVLNRYASEWHTLIHWLVTVVVAFAAVYCLKKLFEKAGNPVMPFIQRALGMR